MKTFHTEQKENSLLVVTYLNIVTEHITAKTLLKI